MGAIFGPKFRNEYLKILAADYERGVEPSTEDVRESVDQLFLMGFKESEVVRALIWMRASTHTGHILDDFATCKAYIRRIRPSKAADNSDDLSINRSSLEDGIPDTPYAIELHEKVKHINYLSDLAYDLMVELVSGGVEVSRICLIMNGNFPELVDAFCKRFTNRHIRKFAQDPRREKFVWRLN